MSNSSKLNASNPKLWLLIGIGLAGAVVLIAETRRRRRRRELPKEGFGAFVFVERFELVPILQPNQTQTLSALTFAVKDVFVRFVLHLLILFPSASNFSALIVIFYEFVCGRFDVKEYVTGFGNPQWKKTHAEAEKTAIVITALLSNGATCVGKTVMDEFSFGYVIASVTLYCCR